MELVGSNPKKRAGAKKPAIEIVVEVSGGCVTAVYASSPNVTVDLLDHDNEEGLDLEEENDKADLRRMKALEAKICDMNHVW